jgi:hypothetical protein
MRTLVVRHALDFAASKSAHDLLRNIKRPSLDKKKVNNNKADALFCSGAPQQATSTPHDNYDRSCLQIPADNIFTPNF